LEWESGSEFEEGSSMDQLADDYAVSTDRTRLDRDLVSRFLTQEAYWSTGIPRETVERAIDNSLCFAIYKESDQVGFARVVTDLCTFVWICDVFVIPEHRRRGLGTRLIRAMLEHPDLQGLRRWILATRDAHGLYEKCGFSRVDDPERFMEIKHNAAQLYGPTESS
jgi:GNAT superfamily N-acetyltransferase